MVGQFTGLRQRRAGWLAVVSRAEDFSQREECLALTFRYPALNHQHRAWRYLHSPLGNGAKHQMAPTG
jgi:hypothetical protein